MPGAIQLWGESDQGSLEVTRSQAEGLLEKMLASGTDGKEELAVPSEPQSLICEMVINQLLPYMVINVYKVLRSVPYKK